MKKRQKVEFTKRVYSPELLDQFKCALYDANWDDICTEADNTSNVSDLYSKFSDIFCNIFEIFFPLKTVKRSKRSMPQQAWMTRGLVKSCNKKSRLYKAFLQTLTPEKEKAYIKYRNKLKSILEVAKRKSTKVNFVHLTVTSTKRGNF